MKKRLITSIFLVLVFVPAIYFGNVLFLILGILLSVVASYEMISMFSKKGKALDDFRFIIPVFSGLIVLIIYFASTRGFNPAVFTDPIISRNDIIESLLYHFWVVIVFVAAAIISLGLLIFKKGSTAHDMMACIMTLAYCGLIMGYVISIRYLFPLGISSFLENQLWGGRSFAYLIVIVVSTDSFAYLIGTKFGKNKLCPDISPNKTKEGALGGLLAGGVIGTIAAFLLQVVGFQESAPLYFKIIVILFIFVFSIIISFAVQLGDLVASKLKRSYEISDFGNIFPGHGGVLDRFDSLIFAGAVYYVIAQFIQLVVLGIG